MNLFIFSSFVIVLAINFCLIRIWSNKFVVPALLSLGGLAFYPIIGTFNNDAMKLVMSSENAKLAESGLLGLNQHPTGNQKGNLDVLLNNLESRLKTNPEDISGWVLLARSYFNQQDFTRAAYAFEKALELSPGHPDLLADLADSLATSADGNLNGRPMELINLALKNDPNHQKSLALAATAAMNNEQPSIARKYWESLLNTLPPESQDSQMVKNLLTKLDSKDNSEVIESITKSSEISGFIKVSEDSRSKIMLNKINETSAIFIIAKGITDAKMPIAVLKIPYGSIKQFLSEKAPIPFTISDRNNMRPNIKLSATKNLVIQARFSFKGIAMKDELDISSSMLQVSPNDKTISLTL